MRVLTNQNPNFNQGPRSWGSFGGTFGQQSNDEDWMRQAEREAEEELRAEEREEERRKRQAQRDREAAEREAEREVLAEESWDNYRTALATLRSETVWTALCEGLGLHSSVRPYSRRNPNGTMTIVHEEMYPSVDRVGVTPQGLRISITNAVGVGSDQWKVGRRNLADALGLTDLDIQQDGPTITLLGKAKPAGQ